MRMSASGLVGEFACDAWDCAQVTIGHDIRLRIQIMQTTPTKKIGKCSC